MSIRDQTKNSLIIQYIALLNSEGVELKFLKDAIQEIGFPVVNIFRPSFLVGQRSEKRLYEGVGIMIASFMNLFLVSSARKYRSVKVELLAKTMVSKINSKPGVNYFHFDDFLK